MLNNRVIQMQNILALTATEGESASKRQREATHTGS